MEKSDRSTATHELARYQEALPVRLIETPRDHFVNCKPGETLGAVRARNARDAFDHLPVEDDSGHMIGVLDIGALAGRSDETCVADCCIPINEDLLIGSEVSILEFLQNADRRPFRFLVAKDGIGGLVSLSDIQRLPVRAALFAIITQFEMAMAQLIDARFPDDSWLEHLSDGRRLKIEAERLKASEDCNQVARLLYTQFADKLGLLRRIAKERGDNRSRDEFDDEFERLQSLRDQIAHANAIGITREDAKDVIDKVRTIGGWIAWIECALKEIGTQNQ